MPHRNLVRAFLGLWWTLGVVLFAMSVQAVLHGAAASDAHLVLLGGVEATCAVLFLVPRTLRAGGIGLLVTFAVAFLAHAARGEVVEPLLVYGAAVVFVLVHGAPPWSAARA